MHFLNPWGLLGGLLLPIIVLFYLRKKQRQEAVVPNLSLWEEVIKEIEGAKVRKINKYLLLFLQLLLGSLLVLALANPYYSTSFKEEVITIALDSSLSMNAVENGESYWEKAKKEIELVLDNLPKNTKVNLALLGKNGQLILENQNKEKVKKKLATLICTRESLHIPNCQDFLEKIPGKKIIVSDKELNWGDKKIKIGKNFINCGILEANYDYFTQTVISRIKNYSPQREEVVVQIGDESGIRDCIKLSINAQEEKDLKFKIAPDRKYISLQINNADMLKEDNVYYLPIGKEFKKNVYIIGRDSFLEAALKSIPYINLYIEEDLNKENLASMDLLIVNKRLPLEELPTKNLWVLKPDQAILDKKINTASPITANKTGFLASLSLQNIVFNDAVALKKNKDYQNILQIDEEPIMMAKEEQNKKILLSSVDWQKSNIVLRPEFPILVRNIVDWALEKEVAVYNPGDYLELDAGEEIILKDIGIHTQGDGKTILVNPPPELVIGTETVPVKDKSLFKKTHFPLDSILIMLALGLLVLEWEVYKYENFS